MTASGAATTEVSAMSERPASGTATVAIPSTLSIPNKPVVPTAPDVPNGNPLHPLRRHTGQSLGGFDSEVAPPGRVNSSIGVVAHAEAPTNEDPET